MSKKSYSENQANVEKLCSDDDLTAYQNPQPLGLFNLPEPKPQGLLSTHAWEIFDSKDG